VCTGASSSDLLTSLKNYDFTAVNRLLHIDDSRKIDLEDPAQEIGNLLVEHNLHDMFGVTRLHYHYTLNAQEKVVSSVHRLGQKLIKTPKTMNFSYAEESVVPYIFQLTDDGGVLPLEFIDLSSFAYSSNGQTVAESILASLTVLQSAYLFLGRLSTQLKSMEGLNLLGLQIIFEDQLLHRPQVVGNATNPCWKPELHEDNWFRYQEMSYRPLDPDLETTTTSWRFIPGDQISSAPIIPRKATCYCVGRCFCQRPGSSHMHLSDGHNQYD